VHLLAGPDVAVFKVLEDINLPNPFRSILKPAVPIAIMGKPILSGAGFKNFIPGL